MLILIPQMYFTGENARYLTSKPQGKRRPLLCKQMDCFHKFPLKVSEYFDYSLAFENLEIESSPLD